MPKQKAELRVVVYDGQRYGLYWRASLHGYDIYAGPPPLSKGDVFRMSYHETGQRHFYLFHRRMGEKTETPPVEITGKLKVNAWSHSLTNILWGYRPKPDSKTRRSLILDLRDLRDVPSFTVELWFLEPRRGDLTTEVLEEEYAGGGLVLNHILADWCVPHILTVVWTLVPEGWTALRRSV